MTTSDERLALFEAWYMDTYDGDSPDWDDVDLPLMYQCWEGGHRAGRREAFGEVGTMIDREVVLGSDAAAPFMAALAAEVHNIAAKEEA